jgi:hypothetical protein
MKTSLIEHGQEFIQHIFGFLVQESKEDLTSLLKEFVDTIDELKTPSTDLAHLKKNKDKYQEVRNKLHLLEGRREPIKKKFNFIQEYEDLGMNELSEDEKNKLSGLDEAWNKFKDGLEDSNLII